MADRINIQEVEPWEHNDSLRNISQAGIDAIDANAKFGQHTDILIYFSPEGKKIALGGNNRLKRWKADPNYQEVKYTKAEFGQDEKGFYPILDGRVYKDPQTGEIPYHFATIEEGMIQLALSHNGQFAYTNEDKIKELFGQYTAINWKMFSGVYVEPVNMQQLKDALVYPKDKKKLKPQIVIEFQTIEDLQGVQAVVSQAVTGINGVKIKLKG
jgi:hypothetical protein